MSTARPRYTDAELEYIKAHCNGNAKLIAAAINRPYKSIYRFMHQFRNGTFERRRRAPDFYYAIYLRKTDELVCSGTAKECAEHLGMSKTSFHSMVCRVRKGLTKKWDVYAEPYNKDLD